MSSLAEAAKCKFADREYLFRGRTEEGKWIYGSLLVWKREEPCREYYIVNMYLDGDCVVPESVGMFTGLRDSNGKKIFEGDILKYGHCNPKPGMLKGANYGVVTYGAIDPEFPVPYHCFGLAFNDLGRSTFFAWKDFCFDDDKYCFVVGNKYENPDFKLGVGI